MERTGVYWRRVYHILEGSLEMLLVNAQHVKMVPGRKTDIKDCQWIAQLLAWPTPWEFRPAGAAPGAA